MRWPRQFCCNMRLRFRTELAVAAGALVLLSACSGNPHGAPVRVIVPPGSTFRDATDSLSRHAVLESPRLFRAYAMLRRRDRNIKAGTYLLQRGMGWDDILQALTLGKGLAHTIVVPEGFNLTSISALLERTMKAQPESIAAAVRDSTLRRELDVPTPVLEGYLFPDTYVFPDAATPRQVVTTMVRRFQQAWNPEWNSRLEALTMTRHDVMTLASIIEKEAKLSAERPLISAVYHNRLRIGMPLQADPTVQYAMGVHTNRVLYRDLKTASPYNTYRVSGLPPGPIASPGKASIEAALFPADVPYLYFVASGTDGHHEFRTTFSAHTQAIRDARKARTKRAPTKR